MKRNIFLILIDGWRYDSIAESGIPKNIIPNITKLINEGVEKRIISNGMFTQVAFPTVLTQTFPLDYDGHNFGIKNRPKSFIEILKSRGFETSFISAAHITGPLRYYERGADKVLDLCDYKSLIEMYLRQYLDHEINLFKKKKTKKSKFMQQFQKSYGDLLDYAMKEEVRSKDMHANLGKIDNKLKKRLVKEKKILYEDPNLILKKIISVPSSYYFYFLGEKVIQRGELIKAKILERIKSKINNLTITLSKKFSMRGYKVYPNYMVPSAEEVFQHSFKIVKNKKKNIFSFIHLMDAHHSEGPGRTLHMLKILKHLPKLLKSNHKLSRGLFYDLALIYIDRELGIFFEKLKRQKLYQNSTFVLFGDHGWGKDLNRDKKMIGELGLRTYYEHINVPLIVSPLKNIKTTNNGLHDTMSVSATILDLLKIPKHNSFLGKSILNKGSQFIITESTSRGNCDIINKKIYFIITGDKFKLMVSYYNKKLQPLRLYDLENDSREMKNLINDKGFKGEVNLMIDYLKKKRKKLFDKI